MVQFGKYSVAAIALFGLSACGDPLRNFEDVSDVTFAEEEPVSVVPTQAEVNRKGGFLSRVWRQPEDSQVPKNTPQLAPLPQETEAPASADADVIAVAEPAEIIAVAEPSPEPAPKSRGLLSWLAGQAPKPEAPAEPGFAVDAEKVQVLTDPVEEAKVETEANVQLASLTPEEQLPKPETKRSGLFSRGEQKQTLPRRQASNSPDVPYGIVLEFGTVGRVCEARSKPLGAKIETSGNRGQTYTLYDSVPGATGPRTFYVTGFSDKCPRQFTAALALFGAPQMHEQLRYGRPAVTYPYSETDRAYENIKSRVCGVGPRKPCGSKIDRLSRDTVFISTYERFTDNGRWADLLVHDGQVVATSVKWPGQRVQ